MNALTDLGIIIGLENNDAWQQSTLKVAGGMVLGAACGYGGTYFFTHHPPLVGAMYVGSAALVTQIAYRALEKLKEVIDHPLFKHAVTAIQLLQIPLFFHLLHACNGQFLSAGVKLEILIATAHFMAIPILFHVGIAAWEDPTVERLAAFSGIMLTLANGLRYYVGMFP